MPVGTLKFLNSSAKFKDGDNGVLYLDDTNKLKFINNSNDVGTIIANVTSNIVGIGTIAPSYPLHIEESSSSVFGILYKNTADTVEQGFYSSNTGGWCGTKNLVNMRFGVGFNTKMTIDTSGKVGIGTSSPNARLHVKHTSGTVISHQNHDYYHYNLDNNLLKFKELNGAVGSVVAQIDGHLWLNGGGIYFTSDSRIKKNIEEINDNEALLKIRQIKPYKYNYIDELQRGTNDVYGFIAQEIKDIIPHSVKIQDTMEIVPNIYKNALYNNNIITFEQPHNLNINGNIKLIKPNNTEVIVPYTIVDTLKINIDVSTLSDDEKPSNDLVQDENGNDLSHNIFVYGTEVNDFHVLNKEHIWTTSVAALQEVDRIQQADAVKIQTLETKYNDLETKYNDLLARVASLEGN